MKQLLLTSLITLTISGALFGSDANANASASASAAGYQSPADVKSAHATDQAAAREQVARQIEMVNPVMCAEIKKIQEPFFWACEYATSPAKQFAYCQKFVPPVVNKFIATLKQVSQSTSDKKTMDAAIIAAQYGAIRQGLGTLLFDLSSKSTSQATPFDVQPAKTYFSAIENQLAAAIKKHASPSLLHLIRCAYAARFTHDYHTEKSAELTTQFTDPEISGCVHAVLTCMPAELSQTIASYASQKYFALKDMLPFFPCNPEYLQLAHIDDFSGLALLPHRATCQSLEIQAFQGSDVNSPIVDIPVDELRDWNSLRSLAHVCYRATQFPAVVLQALPNLTSLTLMGYRITTLAEEDYAAICAAQKLESLHLINTPLDEATKSRLRAVWATRGKKPDKLRL